METSASFEARYAPSSYPTSSAGCGGTFFWIDPAEQLVAIYLSQSPGRSPVQLRRLIKQVVTQARALFRRFSNTKDSEGRFPVPVSIASTSRGRPYLFAPVNLEWEVPTVVADPRATGPVLIPVGLEPEGLRLSGVGTLLIGVNYIDRQRQLH